MISGRVHPGETVGSWMMKGVIDFLTGDSLEAQALRKLFVFKIIPMLNPDGVINGNYRCSLSGGDLNRRWKTPSKILHPTIYEAKKLCRDFQQEREVALIIDLHGHSRNKNIFMYGNVMPDDPSTTRMFPFIMSKLFDYFSFNDSRFSVTKSKEKTLRISLFRELNIPCIYTMEASFCGASQGELKDMHFNAEHYKQAGEKLFHALVIYSKIDCYEVVYGKKRILELDNENEDQQNLNFDDIAKEFEDNKEELLYQSEADSSAGSDSEPSEDNMSDGEMSKILPIKPKKPKKLVSQSSFKKRQRDLEKKMKEKARLKREELEKAKSKSPVKKVHNNYRNILKDRFNLGKVKKVEMVDAWTQTSNNEEDAKNSTNTTPNDTRESTIDNIPTLMSRDSTNTNFEDNKTEETPISLYKRQDTDSKFRVRVNSTISNNKTFRSPISNSINSDYKKRE